MTKKYIVVTGATSGIGKALCEHFSKNNIVYAGYRNAKFVEELKQISPNIVPFYIDMKSEDSINSAAEFINSQTSHIDTLINAAGCVVAGAVEKLDVKRIKEQFDVNTFGHLDFTQKLLPLLDGAKIINISSMSSFGIFPFVAPYCASKRALDILFNSMVLETHRNIKVVSVKPGVIATPLWGKSIKTNETSLTDIEGFEKELNYLINNAKKNEAHGLDVACVVKLIARIHENPHPKSSYTIGRDAKVAEFISKLPQDWVNKLVKVGFEMKLRRGTKK